MVQATKFGQFKGMDNIHDDIELPNDILRRAINVDVLDSGRLRRRKGSAPVLAASSSHSMWSDGARAYFILDNAMREFYTNGTSTSLGTFAAGDNHAAYVKVGEDVFATCKTAQGRIRAGVLAPWGIEVPTIPPTLTVTAGVLPPGTYHAAVTYLLADGRESGASRQATITLTTDGGIATTAMPVPTNAAVTRKRLYLSTANGEVLFMAEELLAADQFANIGAPAAGAVLRTAYLSPPPAGIALAHVNGKIFIVDAADQTVLWYTEALDYEHVDIRKNYYQYGAPISVIAAVTDGLYVCADNTYFLPGAGNKDAGQRVVLEFGAIAGSAAAIPNTANAIWMTERGPVIGKDSGVVELLADKRIASGGMTDTAAMVREKDGISQFVVVGSNSEASALQAGSYADAEIIRRAV